MLCFANVYLFIFFNGRLILRPWLTEVRDEILHVVDLECH